ncbi:hypothetical protein Mapa_005840 [Marchantia paleacea]|nr:hypothetical protein Mapa_005840 [Marchantia paleacea]
MGFSFILRVNVEVGKRRQKQQKRWELIRWIFSATDKKPPGYENLKLLEFSILNTCPLCLLC